MKTTTKISRVVRQRQVTKPWLDEGCKVGGRRVGGGWEEGGGKFVARDFCCMTAIYLGSTWVIIFCLIISNPKLGQTPEELN